MSDHDIDYWLQISPFELSQNDRRSLLTESDKDWTAYTWNDLKKVITSGDKNFSILTRWPSEMRKYLLWRKQIKYQYPDIATFVLTERLGWTSGTEAAGKNKFTVRDARPFADPADFCLRRNDWPYAFENDIAHIVAWLKTPIEVDELGNPTEESRQLIEQFVDQAFRRALRAGENSEPGAEIIWFKNQTRWQSVRALEHIHILTRGVHDDLIRQWTDQRESEIIARSWSPNTS